MFTELTNLQTLSLSENTKLSPWTFPDVSKSTSLVQVQFDNTKLYDTLPDVFQSLNILQSIRLSYNNLNDTLLPSLTGSMIQNLWINNQNVGFTSTLDVLSNMTDLLQVWVHKNMFTGQIPDLSKSMGIFDIKLRENLLTGLISRSLINLSSLENISLSNNKLQGPFPKFPNTVENIVVNGTNNFCNNNADPFDPQVTALLEIACGNMVTVNLAKKNLVGTISSAIVNLTKLKNLNINNNNLTGSILNGGEEGVNGRQSE
ncbi:hypothetical protein GOBAR_AA10606 [Gossypium barbadense]|uniref:Leucine-rich repeat-containing N-terminal plant-type domain-containing protein n=1 Tax=Gossypium barbadense TaxID=3634 RepID=A0A2P5Y3B9_GOSBA|nr:hypothetical protein GOBAR_AA10606 [Gossypium barbadense]